MPPEISLQQDKSGTKKDHTAAFIPASLNNARIDVFLPCSRATLLGALNDFHAMPQYRLAQNPGIFPDGSFRKLFRAIFSAMIGARQSDFIYSLLRPPTHIKSQS
jgi:hypothetical protein